MISTGEAGEKISSMFCKEYPIALKVAGRPAAHAAAGALKAKDREA
jgi:hypothetical protein